MSPSKKPSHHRLLIAFTILEILVEVASIGQGLTLYSPSTLQAPYAMPTDSLILEI